MQARGVHLVGSVPLEDTEAVFRAVASRVGPHLRRITDGETGVRSNWTHWQQAVFARTPGLVTDDVRHGSYSSMPKYRFGSGVSEVRFGPLGYAQAALSSWVVFRRLRAAGVLPDVRFQVSLPTPMAPIRLHVDARDQAAIEPAYEAAMLRELELITDAIPASDLAVQWDTAVEFGMLEGVFPAWIPDLREGIVSRLTRLGNALPADVHLGYHLCYGDSGHRHFVEPSSTALAVELANAVAAGLSRPLSWIHLPVPIGRTDPEYFAPLRSLALPAETELYLGLLHNSDGEPGARKRMAAALSAVDSFGIATECGFGRRPPETVPGLLELHAAVAELVV
ncbi:hypothetical protein VSH64_23655 [Amycolatopsis rhabdoformis]|uniref:Cobalamin-independent methionine synthase MetE C-terminal/archaeal domain-containing protein n=1 Tax=Amycolatopsis rhabdoformis TaxID=1448059 RepID=A0ABZ1ILF4_9PSEU|nr:hypothetical protein [Amycolatopsis rhabdoformis]WSE35030.1 hypothetical protein VSH64_23655 [Amycolatopsis rhabdoformis]